MSLRLYCGEYLTHPAPLHFGMNHCTHGCWYCFANLNRANRRMVNDDLPKIARWFEKDKGPLEYWYLKNGFPILVSNDSDPFAKSNAESTRTLIELSRLYNFGLCWQTKGARDRDVIDLAIAGKPTVFDITLSSDDSELLRRMEPGAPSYEERLQLIRDFKAAGHHVIVSQFPFVPGWWKDYPAALAIWKELGVSHLWTGELHFSKWQVAALNKATLDTYRPWVEYALKRTKKPDRNVVAVMRDMVAQNGMLVFDSFSSYPHPGFWEPYFELGYPFFPTLDGLFFDLEYVGEGKPVAFDFEFFDQWCNSNAPSDLSIYRDYLQPFARSLRNSKVNMRCRSFREVHGFLWKCLEYPTCLRSKHLNILTNQKGELLVDEQGRYIMVYNRDEMEEWGYADTGDIQTAVF